MTRLARLELYLTIVDEGEPRKRWNGAPMCSKDADAALLRAVEAAENSLKSEGMTVAHASYGVVGQNVPAEI